MRMDRHIAYTQYLGQLALVWHELVAAVDTIVTVQLHDGSETLPTLLTANGTVPHRKVDRAQARVVFPLTTHITT
jgi:hypothetical protein